MKLKNLLKAKDCFNKKALYHMIESLKCFKIGKFDFHIFLTKTCLHGQKNMIYWRHETILLTKNLSTIMIENLIAKSIDKYFGKETKEEVITVKRTCPTEAPRNKALEQIHYRVKKADFDALAVMIPEFIRKYGALSPDDKYLDKYSEYYYESCYATPLEGINSKGVFDCDDRILKSFCLEICAGKKPDVADYKRKYDLQQSLRRACGNGDLLLFDKLLEEGADINYRYGLDLKDKRLSLDNETLWQFVQKCYSKQSPMYRYFLTRSECTGVQEFLAKKKKAKEKAKAEEDLIASRTAQQ